MCTSASVSARAVPIAVTTAMAAHAKFLAYRFMAMSTKNHDRSGHARLKRQRRTCAQPRYSVERGVVDFSESTSDARGLDHPREESPSCGDTARSPANG